MLSAIGEPNDPRRAKDRRSSAEPRIKLNQMPFVFSQKLQHKLREFGLREEDVLLRMQQQPVCGRRDASSAQVIAPALVSFIEEVLRRAV